MLVVNLKALFRNALIAFFLLVASKGAQAHQETYWLALSVGWQNVGAEESALHNAVDFSWKPLSNKRWEVFSDINASAMLSEQRSFDYRLGNRFYLHLSQEVAVFPQLEYVSEFLSRRQHWLSLGAGLSFRFDFLEWDISSAIAMNRHDSSRRVFVSQQLAIPLSNEFRAKDMTGLRGEFVEMTDGSARYARVALFFARRF